MSKRPIMEKVLGSKIGRDETRIPGAVPNPPMEYRYYSGAAEGPPQDRFIEMASARGTNYATKGSAFIEGCRVFLPDGSAFYGLSYWNDIEGWRKNVEEGAKALGLKLAWIEGEEFVVEDGRRFPISDCRYEFY